MKPTDFRNATFWSLRGELEGLRRQTYEAWRKYGPGTTREIATKSGISILTLRPRSTELLQIGLLEICEEPFESEITVEDRNGEAAAKLTVLITPQGNEGIYRVTNVERWNRFRAEKVNSQLMLI